MAGPGGADVLRGPLGARVAVERSRGRSAGGRPGLPAVQHVRATQQAVGDAHGVPRLRRCRRRRDRLERQRPASRTLRRLQQRLRPRLRRRRASHCPRGVEPGERGLRAFRGGCHHGGPRWHDVYQDELARRVLWGQGADHRQRRGTRRRLQRVVLGHGISERVRPAARPRRGDDLRPGLGVPEPRPRASSQRYRRHGVARGGTQSRPRARRALGI